jgi:hypothetical protein
MMAELKEVKIKNLKENIEFFTSVKNMMPNSPEAQKKLDEKLALFNKELNELETQK